MQITMGVFLSVAYGANSAHTSFGILAMIGHLHDSGTVPATANLGMGLRCVSAGGTAIGTLLWGRRLAPITGLCSMLIAAWVWARVFISHAWVQPPCSLSE